jgi:periplasmic protein TonB
VLLSVVIGADGKVYEVGVVRGLEPGLDTNAVAAVSAWRFKPAEKNGKPVRVRAYVDMNFRLR